MSKTEIQAVELEDSTYKSKDLPVIDTYDDDFIFKTAWTKLQPASERFNNRHPFTFKSKVSLINTWQRNQNSFRLFYISNTEGIAQSEIRGSIKGNKKTNFAWKCFHSFLGKSFRWSYLNVKFF